VDAKKANKAVAQFYHALDKQTAESLTEQQKRDIEQAVQSMGLVEIGQLFYGDVCCHRIVDLAWLIRLGFIPA